MKLQDEAIAAAVDAANEALSRDPDDVDLAVRAALETVIHAGYVKVGPPLKTCPECNGDKMTEGTIGYFACLGCGGRGKIPVS